MMPSQPYRMLAQPQMELLTQNNLDLKSQIIIWIVPQQDTANVPDAFGQTAQGDSDHVRPGFVADAEVEVYEERDAEETGEECVRRERGGVAVDCAFDGAFGTYGFAPSGDTGTIWCAAHRVLRERVVGKEEMVEGIQDELQEMC
jgi:hypothetical protein